MRFPLKQSLSSFALRNDYDHYGVAATAVRSMYKRAGGTVEGDSAEELPIARQQRECAEGLSLSLSLLLSLLYYYYTTLAATTIDYTATITTTAAILQLYYYHYYY